MSKHVIKARDSRLALVDDAVEGFIRKPHPAGTQPVDLPTFKDPHPVVEEILSSDDEANTQSEENEEDILRESIESLVHDEDFEVFYCPDKTEDITSSSRLTTTLVSENQEVSEVFEAMVLEKRMLDLLSLWNPMLGPPLPRSL